MPHYLATIGGCFDPTDKDSLVTALREVEEEAAIPLNPNCVFKFYESLKCDFFLSRIGPVAPPKATDSKESADAAKIMNLLPVGSILANFWGHVWVPAHHLVFDPDLKLMGGLVARINEALALL